MIIPTITNIWDIMDLIFRKNYKDVILSSNFKLLLLAKNNNLKIAVPYWEFCDDEYNVDYIELDVILCKPFYDKDNKCFIFKNIRNLFQSSEAIQLQLMKLFPNNEEHIYKHFIIHTINNEIQKRSNSEHYNEEVELSNLLNQLVF